MSTVNEALVKEEFGKAQAKLDEVPHEGSCKACWYCARLIATQHEDAGSDAATVRRKLDAVREALTKAKRELENTSPPPPFDRARTEQTLSDLQSRLKMEEDGLRVATAVIAGRKHVQTALRLLAKTECPDTDAALDSAREERRQAAAHFREALVDLTEQHDAEDSKNMKSKKSNDVPCVNLVKMANLHEDSLANLEKEIETETELQSLVAAGDAAIGAARHLLVDRDISGAKDERATAAFVFHDVNTRFLKQIDRLDKMQALNDEIVEAERQQVVLGGDAAVSECHEKLAMRPPDFDAARSALDAAAAAFTESGEERKKLHTEKLSLDISRQEMIHNWRLCDAALQGASEIILSERDKAKEHLDSAKFHYECAGNAAEVLLRTHELSIDELVDSIDRLVCNRDRRLRRSTVEGMSELGPQTLFFTLTDKAEELGRIIAELVQEIKESGEFLQMTVQGRADLASLKRRLEGTKGELGEIVCQTCIDMERTTKNEVKGRLDKMTPKEARAALERAASTRCSKFPDCSPLSKAMAIRAARDKSMQENKIRLAQEKDSYNMIENEHSDRWRKIQGLECDLRVVDCLIEGRTRLNYRPEPSQAAARTLCEHARRTNQCRECAVHTHLQAAREAIDLLSEGFERCNSEWMKADFLYSRSAAYVRLGDCEQEKMNVLDFYYKLGVEAELPAATSNYTKALEDATLLRQLRPLSPRSFESEAEASERLKGNGTASGLKWVKVGTNRPTQGRELINVKLQNALTGQTEFGQEEWNSFHVDDLSLDDFIRAGNTYYKPAGTHARRVFETMSLLSNSSSRSPARQHLKDKLKVELSTVLVGPDLANEMDAFKREMAKDPVQRDLEEERARQEREQKQRLQDQGELFQRRPGTGQTRFKLPNKVDKSRPSTAQSLAPALSRHTPLPWNRSAVKGELVETVKRCPKCQTLVEKDGGCNHMVCLNVLSDGTTCGCNFDWSTLLIVKPRKGVGSAMLKLQESQNEKYFKGVPDFR